MTYELFKIICNRIEVSGEKLLSVKKKNNSNSPLNVHLVLSVWRVRKLRGSVDTSHVTGQVDLAGRARQVKGSVQSDSLSWRCDLTKVNPKFHMNYSIIFTENIFSFL